MIEKLAFVGIGLLGSIVALFTVPVSANSVIAQATTPTPPVVIPAWILGGGNFYTCCNDVDPGATPDQHLFAGVIDASEATDDSLKTNCPGIGSGGSNVSNCNPYKYVNMLWLVCDTTLSGNGFDYLAMSDPSGFVHYYEPPPATPGPRFTPSSGKCSLSNNTYATNPDDSAWLSWLAMHAWTTDEANFPAPYGIDEDNVGIHGYTCDASYEYGDAFCNQKGKSASPQPTDWESALGVFANNTCTSTTCFYFVGNGLQRGDGSNTGSCSTISNSHCFVPNFGGIIDDMDAIDNFCTAAYGTNSTTNTQGIEAEEVVFLKGTPAPSPSPTSGNTPVYANTQTIVDMINTMSHLVTDTTGPCANVNAIDIESSGGSFPGLVGYGAGTVAAGIPIREEATAFRFLVPDTNTLVPDRIVPFYYRIGLTTNKGLDCCKVPYFFEETLVPQGPEVTVGAFEWNGVTQSVGDGCPSITPADTGGAVDLMVTCVSTDADAGAAVFRQEYKHLYINGTDYGPAAVLLNTASTTAVPISSSWFDCTGCDPFSNFHYKLALSGGELKSVVYGSGTISLPCTQPTNCTGDNSVLGNTVDVIPFLMEPHSGMILLASR